MDIVLKIPVRRFVKKYIQSKYGPDLWNFTKDSKEGRFFFSLLERVPPKYANFKKNEDVLQVQVSSRYVNLKGCYISQESIDEFTAYIYNELVSEIVTYITNIDQQIGKKPYARVKLKLVVNQEIHIKSFPAIEPAQLFQKKQAIIDILKKYSIEEDDLAFDTVVKRYQRYSA